MNCSSNLKELLGEYLEGILSADQNESVRKHLEQCPECASEVQQIQMLLPGLKHMAYEHIPADFLVDFYHFQKSGSALHQSDSWKQEEIEEHLTICDRCESEFQKIKAFEEFETASEEIDTISERVSVIQPSPKFLSKLSNFITSRKVRYAIAVAIVLFIVVLPTYLLKSQSKMIAILPFEYNGPSEQEHFADGIIDEIASNIGKVSALGVISPSSTIQYKHTTKKITQVADELGVNYILQGTFIWEKSGGVNKIKLTPRLIRVKDETLIWSETFGASMDEIFELQSEIARKVISALNVTILEPELRYLETKPTDNIEAYEYYIRGNPFFNVRRDSTDLHRAIQMYQKAVESDSNFALAYTKLSRALTEIYWHYAKKDIFRLQQAKETVDKAFRLKPGLPEAHLALGSYYYHNYNFDLALEQLSVAQNYLPNNSDLLAEMGYTQRRQAKWGEAPINIKKASDLDPLDPFKALEAGNTFVYMRKYPEAEPYFDRAIWAAPDWDEAYGRKSYLYVIWKGSVEKAQELLQDPFEKVDWSQYDLILGNYQNILNRSSKLVGAKSGADSASYYRGKAQIYGFLNQLPLMRACYDSARVILENLVKKVNTLPEIAFFHSQLGMAYAGLARMEEAIQEGKKAVELLPISKDALFGAGCIENLARVYVMVGEYDKAIDQLEYLLSIPGTLSITYLRLDPTWAPLRNHPRFQKLIGDKKINL